MTEPFDPRTYTATCLCQAVRRAARSLNRRYDDALAGLGVNNGQLTILMAVSAAPAITMGALSADLDMDRTTLAAALKSLERDGLVSTRPDPADGRARIVSVAKRGTQLLEAAAPRWRKAQADALRAARLEDGAPLLAVLAALS